MRELLNGKSFVKSLLAGFCAVNPANSGLASMKRYPENHPPRRSAVQQSSFASFLLAISAEGWSFLVHTGIRLNGSAFWVVHRSRAYGPFDYEWSADFEGVEFLYCGEKFGEYCSVDELYADLKHFKLPQRVYEVASVAIATVVKSIIDGVPEEQRVDLLTARLEELGFPKFARIEQTEHTK